MLVVGLNMLSVKVETVFDDGIVVSYTNKSGVSFRGALLPFKTTRSTESLEHNLQRRWNYCIKHSFAASQTTCIEYKSMIVDVKISHL